MIRQYDICMDILCIMQKYYKPMSNAHKNVYREIILTHERNQIALIGTRKLTQRCDEFKKNEVLFEYI